MTEPNAYAALVGHTHLFPGARCRIQGLPDARAFASAPEPADIHLWLSDGTATPAEFRTEPTAGPALAVAAHTTAAGTPIADRTWAVKGIAPKGDEVELTIGAPIRG
ncbi:hypothetical protein KME66_18545 [Streptomyces sp. YPW6]|uniref:hypothetical protein n=1 Tax=Streptomyces sp. YPW6 TaxID=2840373 RepID=UPI001C0E853E|nr:hypothetical protein [Streptomyces sp. YPW6]QWQ42761.1 hypothetical protein KME66_18545 [Streptomyces sp. YPW6]